MQTRHIILGVIFAVVAFLRGSQAVTPPPDGCYANFTTAEGCNALGSLSAGTGNTGLGWFSLFSNTTTDFNTGVGAGALALNNANNNTAVGAGALFLNTVGEQNTAVGANALVHNDSGSNNNAIGVNALFTNTTGLFNNAHGRSALSSNIEASENNAFGDLALENLTTGTSNTAIGDDAGRFLVTGSGNICVGDEAGTGLGASVNNCIAIGAPGAGPFATFDNTCFIGNIFDENVSDPGTQTAVYVDQFNVVGVFNSSRQYKHDIQPMDKASEALHRLKPVTFKFNSDWKQSTQYGLIAEDVAEVDPQLVVVKNGETITVRYEQINAMLLNEFLKEHKTVQELKTTVALQKKQIDALTAGLEKVSAQLELNNPATKVVVNKP